MSGSPILWAALLIIVGCITAPSADAAGLSCCGLRGDVLIGDNEDPFTDGGAAEGAEGAEAEDDEDLFADNENEEEEAAKEEMRTRAAAAHKEANKDKPAAKTNMVLDIKGWDDQTDFVKLEALVREIAMDGLLWGSAGLEEVGYGIKKLRITCVVEDDKVSVDDLEEKITSLEDYVQSVDVAAMQKI